MMTPTVTMTPALDQPDAGKALLCDVHMYVCIS